MKYLRLLLIVGATLLSSTVWAESGSDRSIER
ncbi:co-regulatory protein PtrA N-terminal domain-containing protein, partial [Pseudomonas aeruginosa]